MPLAMPMISYEAGTGSLARAGFRLVLAVMAFNLTRVAATITGPGLAKAAWPWETAWTSLFNLACGPPPAPTT